MTRFGGSLPRSDEPFLLALFVPSAARRACYIPLLSVRRMRNFPHSSGRTLRIPLTNRRLAGADCVFAVVVLTFTVLAASIWWLSAIVPGQDYPQFLVFVRAVRDMGDPTSPFRGTYDTAPWFTPTSLPVHLTSFLASLCSGSVETAGRLLLTAQNVGLVAASLFLLQTLGRPRWTVVLVFPFIHSVWTVVGGFVAFATAFPLVVVGWALTVRWLSRLDFRSGVALAATLSTTLLWHGIAYAQLGLGFAVLWAFWRAPTRRARILGVVPALPSIFQCAIWTLSQLGHTPNRGHAAWQTPLQAARSFIDTVWSSVPHASARALTLAALVAAGLLIAREDPPTGAPVTGAWRARNPFLVVAAAYLVAYFAFPMFLAQVEGFSNRFAYVAVLASVFAWKLPRARVARALVLSAVLAFSAWSLGDLVLRVRAFDVETRGASALIDRVGLHETLYYGPARRGYSEAFAASENKAMIELEQFATIRHGGLPNSSFAGYGSNYVRYRGDRNPMPGLFGSPRYGPQLTRFDYVLVRNGHGHLDEQLRLVESRDGWELYGVCGSHRFPTCTDVTSTRFGIRHRQ